MLFMEKIKKSIELSNTYKSLKEQYAPEQPLAVRKILTAHEKKSKYILEISENKKSVMFCVDGNIIKEGPKCDKLILVDTSSSNEENSWTEIFLELKGKNISHAIDQLRETLKKDMFKHPSNKSIKARIVAVSFPANKSNPIMERARREFAGKTYKCELKGMKTGQKDNV